MLRLKLGLRRFRKSPMHMVEIVEISAFVVCGASVRTNNALEASGQGHIGQLWQDYAATTATGVATAEGAQAYGVYSQYDSDASGDYRLTVGSRKNQDSANVPVDTQAAADGVTVAAGRYLAFPAQGEMPGAVLQAWQRIWAHFAPEQAHTLPYVRAYKTDFEHYDAPHSAVVYIGIAPR
jgi:predicted transcriptional regulator YdeE